jgi:hypothetical protein
MDPLRRLGLGESRGLRRWPLIAAGSTVYVDDRDALEDRGACRDGDHDRRDRALALAVSQSGKEDGDDGDVSMTWRGLHRSMAAAPRAVGGGERRVGCWAAAGPERESGRK